MKPSKRCSSSFSLQPHLSLFSINQTPISTSYTQLLNSKLRFTSYLLSEYGYVLSSLAFIHGPSPKNTSPRPILIFLVKFFVHQIPTLLMSCLLGSLPPILIEKEVSSYVLPQYPAFPPSWHSSYCIIKNVSTEDGIVAWQVKPPPAVAASHMGTGSRSSYSSSNSSPC